MRICIDTSTLRVRHGGIAIYTLNLVQELTGLMSSTDALLAFDGWEGFRPIDPGWVQAMRSANSDHVGAGLPRSRSVPSFFEAAMRAGSLGRWALRRAKEARFALARDRYDLCHAVVTLPPGPTSKPLIPLIHDISMHRFPEVHPAERLRAFDRWWPKILQSPVINTVSNFSRDEITAVLGFPRERIVVTHPGVEPFYFGQDPAGEQAVLSELSLEGRRIILIVGSQEPRKNVAVALRAFAALPTRVRAGLVLVVAGGRGWGDVVRPADVEALMRAGDIRFTGYVSRLLLRALYRRSCLLVYPSIYEGFGIPVIEALACGSRVAVSAGGALVEAAGPFGDAIESGDVDAWSRAMEAAASGPNVADRERTERRAWAARFTWKSTAEKTMTMYRSVFNISDASQHS
ncbi:MAG: glycosyltransferase family 4 protein [Allorhizobium sp.]